MEAEIWGVLHGIELAWRKGVCRLVVEVDSLVVCKMLHSNLPWHHPLATLINSCRDVLTRDWNVKWQHTFREANQVTDGLARLAAGVPLGFTELVMPPPEVTQVLQEDLRGVTIVRTDPNCNMQLLACF